ncbi:AAA family ATPase [Infirmifilum sp. SLHALR2]|nr:MAG: ATPase [Thermofilum sp. NZ13]
MEQADFIRDARRLVEVLDRVVVGYSVEKRVVLASLLANGHVLLEGPPGIAKTTLAKALARAFGLLDSKVSIGGVEYKGFSRIQFTPDLLPSDVTGSLVYNPVTREFEPRLGPIFAYIVLADEVNRATPRTQSALLEAMQERQVTIGGRTYPLEDRKAGKFFAVLATQNPVEQEGTYPLPEAQLDRFITRVVFPYPRVLEEEKSILRLHAQRLSEPLEDLEPILDPKWLHAAQSFVAEQVAVQDDVLDYVSQLVRFTRPEVSATAREFFELGASPRAGIALLRVAKAWAMLEGRTVATRRDVDAVAFPVLNHRVIPKLDRVIEAEEAVGRYSARYEATRRGLEEIMKSIRAL